MQTFHFDPLQQHTLEKAAKDASERSKRKSFFLTTSADKSGNSGHCIAETNEKDEVQRVHFGTFEELVAMLEK